MASENCEDSVVSNEDMFASSFEDEVSPECSKWAKQSKSEDTEAGSSKEGAESSFRGTPLSKLTKNTGKDQFPAVAVTPRHSVLFKLPVKEGVVPQPWPEHSVDAWDQNHVRMPHSASSLYPMNDELHLRWDLIKQSLSSPITNSHQLEAAIFHYNSRYCDRWDFKVLHSFFSEVLEEVESEYFFTKVLPQVIDLALRLPQLLTAALPLLKQHTTHSVSLTQEQVSSLLANAFLCTFPRRNTTKRDSEYGSFPYINFNRLFSGDWAKTSRISSIHEKLKCIVNYFRRVTNKMPDGVVTFSRQYVPRSALPQWSELNTLLPNMHICSSGHIEDEGAGMLQMDFANKMVGGGVLGRGCVQEEIRFVLCPELILSRLFTEVLDDTEALIVTGCERFNLHKGYSDEFEWDGDYVDTTPRDRYCRRYCSVVAVDALKFGNPRVQFTQDNVNRELNKAYAGFSWGSNESDSSCRESVATGNWGCGAFRGDASLKSLLQLMAAAATGRELAYFTFGDSQLRDKLADMHTFLTQHQVTVGKLYKMICSYSPSNSVSLYDHIHRCVNNKSIPSLRRIGDFFPSKRPRSPEKRSEDSEQKRNNNVTPANRTPTNGTPINGHRLSTDQIQVELETTETLEPEPETDQVKNVEAKSINIHKEKELCLKRLSSSWTNLNESKRDFSPSVKTSSSSRNTSSPGESRNRSFNVNKRGKISDYFQKVSK